MQFGDPFSPFKLFTGIFVPEALARLTDISSGAKLVYARLARYAGDKGECFPRVDTVANEVGLSERQAQRHFAELVDFKLIRRKQRGSTSSLYQFLWHPVFELGASGVTDSVPPGVTDSVPRADSILIRRESIEENPLNNNNGVVGTPRLLSQDDWPQTTALVQGRFLSVDAPFMWRFIHASIQAVVSSGGDPAELTDKNLAWMVEEVFKNPKIYSAGLLLRAVPAMVENLVKRHAKVMR